MQAWEDYLQKLERELGYDPVKKWLRSLTVDRFDACNLYLTAKDSFQIAWFEEHIRPRLKSDFLNPNHRVVKVHLRLPHQSPQTKKTKKTSKQETTGSDPFQITFPVLDPLLTFEHFITQEPNRVVAKLFQHICGLTSDAQTSPLSASELASFNPIYIYGKKGTGKTHLLTAVAHALKAQGKTVIYEHADIFTEHVVTAIRAGEMSQFRHIYRHVDALILDDVHVFSRKGATQEELFHTFNTLHLAGTQIILSANCLPQELKEIEPRLVSRFEWGIAFGLHPLNFDGLKELLRMKAQLLSFPLHNKVAEFLLEEFSSSPHSVLRALKALILRCHLKGDIISSTGLTIPQVKYYLKDLLAEEQKLVVTPEMVFDQVATHFGIQVTDILGKTQTREFVRPRQIAMYLCREELNLPYTKIGELFNKDHSTVMASVRVVSKQLKAHTPQFADPISHISKSLEN